MGTQMVFNRNEIKYLLTCKQREELLAAMEQRMKPDQYGRSTIRSLYYDTEDFLLIRRSLEKPVYKEKLRMRSYCKADGQTEVYVEIKKKYHSTVYKRRVGLAEAQAVRWLKEGILPGNDTQITREIEYFRKFYRNLEPKVFISAQREAFYDVKGSDFRVTFDENILARTDRLSLQKETGGLPLLDSGYVLLELKTAGAIPLWMSAFLTEHRIFPASFSKYGTAYRDMIQNAHTPEEYEIQENQAV